MDYVSELEKQNDELQKKLATAENFNEYYKEYYVDGIYLVRGKLLTDNELPFHVFGYKPVLADSYHDMMAMLYEIHKVSQQHENACYSFSAIYLRGYKKIWSCIIRKLKYEPENKIVFELFFVSLNKSVTASPQKTWFEFDDMYKDLTTYLTGKKKLFSP